MEYLVPRRGYLGLYPPTPYASISMYMDMEELSDGSIWGRIGLGTDGYGYTCTDGGISYIVHMV
jgi:hypothetical protein